MNSISNSPLGFYLLETLKRHDAWRERWEPVPSDESLAADPKRVEAALDELFRRLEDNYPFFHPTYAGQMIKPAHPVAQLGYFAAQLINPNNHALDGGPATGQMEKEVVADIARMFGYTEFLGHLTSSGTIANLEALWVSRELNPLMAVAFSSQAHYTHKRMCQVLGMKAVEVPCDRSGRMDIEALRRLLLSENIGTVVATVGTTGLGALDPLDEMLALQREIPFRIHADAAYGGFYRLIADDDEAGLNGEVFQAMSQCDSIVVDPHKHGLQPYGCGCVLFKDPSVGHFYKHDSPYTYFTSKDLHLGEISLECSRAGASAAALWFTLQVFPLEAKTGLGPVLKQCRKAALAWSELIRPSEHLSLFLNPELDIVTYFAGSVESSSSEISRVNDEVFRVSMEDPQQPVYVSKLRVPTAMLRSRYPSIRTDGPWTTILRSVLLKPDNALFVEELHERMERFAAHVMNGRT